MKKVDFQELPKPNMARLVTDVENSAASCFSWKRRLVCLTV